MPQSGGWSVPLQAADNEIDGLDKFFRDTDASANEADG